MEFLEGEYASAQASLMAQSEKFKTDMQAAQSLDWGRSPCSRGDRFMQSESTANRHPARRFPGCWYREQRAVNCPVPDRPTVPIVRRSDARC